jgi:hypothetical protein
VQVRPFFGLYLLLARELLPVLLLLRNNTRQLVACAVAVAQQYSSACCRLTWFACWFLQVA